MVEHTIESIDEIISYGLDSCSTYLDAFGLGIIPLNFDNSKGSRCLIYGVNCPFKKHCHRLEEQLVDESEQVENGYSYVH